MTSDNGIFASFLAGLFMFMLIVGCFQGSDSTGTSSGTGRAVFMMSDPSADMGAVTSMKVTVDSVQAHSAASGWATVSSSSQTYDLLALKASGDQVLLADAQLKEGSYDQVRLLISKVVVTDAQGDHDAKLPSSELKIVGNLVVNANTTSTVEFDFVASESLHMTGNGKYILTPVVQFETREKANVSIESNNRVKINGGNMVSSAKHGMDLDGNVGTGRMVPADANLSIESDGRIRSKLSRGLD